jgi:hypothetical protein
MIKMERVICFIFIMLFSIVALAATCVPDDTNCSLNQKKNQLMDKLGIKPVVMKVQPTAEDKKPPVFVPFQIPKPGSVSTNNTTQDQSDNTQSSDQPVQNSKEQESTSQSQQPKTETQPIVQQQIQQQSSGIKYR